MSLHKFEIFNNSIFFTVLILFPFTYTHLLADKDIDVFSCHTVIRKKRICYIFVGFIKGSGV